MKATHLLPLSTFAGLAALSLLVCSCRAKDDPSPPTPPAAGTDRATPPAPAIPSGATAAAKEDADSATASATWATIKDAAYDKRADFIAGLNLMMKRLDSGIQALNAKRATMKDGAAADWDFNMKELNNARDYLQSMGSELEKATDGTWTDAKDKVTQAWTRVRNAYDKVTHSTTS